MAAMFQDGHHPLHRTQNSYGGLAVQYNDSLFLYQELFECEQNGE